DSDRVVALSRHVARQFNLDECFTSAGMLTYATLLSLVPLTTVIVSMVAALPGAESWNEQIQDFLFRNFVPAARDTIQDKINELIANAKGLTAAMGIFLVATSIILMHNIEATINRIFGVRTERSWVSRFLIYWASLTLGPILLGASLALSSYFFSLRFIADVRTVGFMAGVLQSITPFLVAGLAFFLTYAAIPNRKVPLRHALIGAVVAALMFEIAKKLFGLFVAGTGSYTAIYGALAAIPIFLVWIYLSWSIILLGASLCAALSTFDRDAAAGDVWPARERFVLLYRLVGRLWEAQKTGASLEEGQLVQSEPATSQEIMDLLENLRGADIVRRDEDGDWVLVRDLSQLSLADLYRTGRYVWPRSDARSLADEDDPWIRRLHEALQDVDEAMGKLDNRSLATFYAGGIGEERKQPEDEPVSSDQRA
ncbi:MAG: YihY family inner membrane protein, partial [Xanthomonadales bacterium]|nr:YihY family inner membrane protein [Xanthomonadales bacterium]